MEAWIPVTLVAATAQTLRFMLQKHLKSTRLNTAGATLSRFVYSAPLVALTLVVYMAVTKQALPETSPRFWVFALSGGLAQILATLCVVALFAERNFAVGITLKKTEVLQAAILGFLILGESVTFPAAGAILLGFVAVLFLSEGRSASGAGLRGHGLFNRAIGLGLLSGVLFAFSGIGYRGATLALASDNPVVRAGLTLALVTASQSLAMGSWLFWRDRAQLGAVLRAWRVAGLVGITSMIGSFGWFLAFTLQTVAYVKALGQVELVLSLLASVLFFRERVTRREIGGIALLLASILILVLVT